MASKEGFSIGLNNQRIFLDDRLKSTFPHFSQLNVKKYFVNLTCVKIRDTFMGFYNCHKMSLERLRWTKTSSHIFMEVGKVMPLNVITQDHGLFLFSKL